MGEEKIGPSKCMFFSTISDQWVSIQNLQEFFDRTLLDWRFVCR